MTTTFNNNRWPTPEPKDYEKYMYLAPDPSLTDYDELYGYALTIDGYQYAQDKWGISSKDDAFSEMVLSYKVSGKWKGSFEGLRFCLFAYQRRIRWAESAAFDEEGRKEFMEIYRTLCEVCQEIESKEEIDCPNGEKQDGKYSIERTDNEYDKTLSPELSISEFMNYVQNSLETMPVLRELEKIIQQRSSKAGTRREEVFTREFLCPTIARYFYEFIRSELSLTDYEIKRGLGTEGFRNCSGFGFTPASKNKHLFTKSDIIKSTPPASWLSGDKKELPNFQACPDFAISSPLPFSCVGEVKYFRSGSPEQAVKELYDAARQVIFYLGVFQGNYDAAMIVMADASRDHSFHKVLKSLNPELMKRFGEETQIYLLTVRLS